MNKEDIKKNLVTGVSAAVGSTMSSMATESVIKSQDAPDELEVVDAAQQETANHSLEGYSNVSPDVNSSAHEEPVMIVSSEINSLPISPEDVIVDPEPVMYGGPVIDDEDLIVIDIDSDMYGGPVDVMYGGPIPDSPEPIDVDCDIYGGPVDVDI